MARRGGKAASRRSRQRKAQQQRQAPSTPAPLGPERAPELERDEALMVSAPAPSEDAFEKADAELRAATPPPGSRATVTRAAGANRSVRARTGDFMMASGPSRLGERAADEYHYVLRDLRNIGVLLVVIAVLLAVAVVLVNVLDIGPA